MPDSDCLEHNPQKMLPCPCGRACGYQASFCVKCGKGDGYLTCYEHWACEVRKDGEDFEDFKKTWPKEFQ